MRYLFLLILALSLGSCKTCPLNEPITEVIVTGLAGYGECGGYDEMKSDVSNLVAKVGICKKDLDVQPCLKFVPDGVCTAKCIACSMVGKSIAGYAKWPSAWLCKKPVIKPEMIDTICQELD